MYSIKINFEQKGLEPVTLNDIKPDHSLLEVLLDNGMELHHNCGGVCACSTCHIYIKKGGEFLQELSDKEEDFNYEKSKLKVSVVIFGRATPVELEFGQRFSLPFHSPKLGTNAFF